ncbi:MAG: MBL fold metallo-hydrolase [Candidatus Diapherotrites archaeon]|nr:MBL fold metallo-hydrolase [Candidatus Diapherotrites archaeon]
MKFVVLGSGGAIPAPIPCCFSGESRYYKENMIYRTGPSIYLYNASVLFDTPEEIRWQLNRESIRSLKHLFYTHWHPDHTAGIRIIEHVGRISKRPIDVYIPNDVMIDFEAFGLTKHLAYFEKKKWMKLNIIKDREPIKIDGITITPLNLYRNDRTRYAYKVSQRKKSIVYAPCSTYQMKVDKLYDDLDVMLLECGFYGNREKLKKKYPWVLDHISLGESIELLNRIKAKRSILTHIEGIKPGPTTKQLQDAVKGTNIEIAYDGMKITL